MVKVGEKAIFFIHQFASVTFVNIYRFIIQTD
nr:MAG TPA: hypothetical protein [Herelleviridae sp.]